MARGLAIGQLIKTKVAATTTKICFRLRAHPHNGVDLREMGCLLHKIPAIIVLSITLRDDIFFANVFVFACPIFKFAIPRLEVISANRLESLFRIDRSRSYFFL